jgi:pimeloyl-ACP methyl ester carboxylesterase
MKTYCNSSSWNNFKAAMKAAADIELRDPDTEYYLDVIGHNVHIDEWLPSGEPKGIVFMIHGGGGNGRILAPFAQPIVDQGWKVIAPDLPGYGLTETRAGYDGDYSEWIDVIQALSEQHEGKKVFFGLSVGGLTAVHTAQVTHGIEGVIATTLLDVNTNKLFIRAARWPWLGFISLIGFKTLGPILDRIKLPLSLAAPLKEMSSDKTAQHYFLTNELIAKRWIPIKFFRTMHNKLLDSNTELKRLLLVHPGSDTWTPTQMSLETFHKLKGNKSFIELTNGSHLPIEQPAYDELQTHVGNFLSQIKATDRNACAG